MTNPVSRINSDDVGVLVSAITENAHRLGLKWLLRPGTVTSGTDASNIGVKVDGDDVATLGVTSMVGNLDTKRRVWLLIVPSVGTYVIGYVGPVLFSGQQVGEPSIRTSNVGPFTLETQIDTVTVVLPIPGVYRVILDAQVQSSVADGGVRSRIRQDSSSGTQIQLRHTPTNAIANQSFLVRMEGRYIASAREEKTFVATALRQAGTGNITATASADVPTYFYVEYVSA